MSLLFKPIFRHLLNGVAGRGAWYASVKFRTPIHVKEIITAIGQRSTISKHDTLAVISILAEIIPEYLKNGHSVHLGDVGVFSLGVSSTAHEHEDDVTAESITTKKIRFLPSVEMKQAVQDTEFIRINK